MVGVSINGCNHINLWSKPKRRRVKESGTTVAWWRTGERGSMSPYFVVTCVLGRRIGERSWIDEVQSWSLNLVPFVTRHLEKEGPFYPLLLQEKTDIKRCRSPTTFNVRNKKYYTLNKEFFFSESTKNHEFYNFTRLRRDYVVIISLKLSDDEWNFVAPWRHEGSIIAKGTVQDLTIRLRIETRRLYKINLRCHKNVWNSVLHFYPSKVWFF